MYPVSFSSLFLHLMNIKISWYTQLIVSWLQNNHSHSHVNEVCEVKQVFWDVRGSANCSCQKFGVSLEEGPCCDQITRSSFVWQTPWGRSSVGKNPVAADSQIYLFFSRKKGCEPLSRQAPCKEAIKSLALWRSLCRTAIKENHLVVGWNGNWKTFVGCLSMMLYKFTKMEGIWKEKACTCLSEIKCIQKSLYSFHADETCTHKT